MLERNKRIIMGRPKKEPVVTVPTSVPKITSKVVNSKEAELQKQIKQLQDMMEEMQKALAVKIEVASTQLTKVSREEYGEIVAPVGENIEQVPFRQYIRVMSLTTHRLTLSTEGYGIGTLYNFTNYGQIQSIL
jgi:hypothetical protein